MSLMQALIILEIKWLHRKQVLLDSDLDPSLPQKWGWEQRLQEITCY